MEFLQPRSLPDALAIKAERRDAVPIAGGKEAPARDGVETPLEAEVWVP